MLAEECRRRRRAVVRTPVEKESGPRMFHISYMRTSRGRLRHKETFNRRHPLRGVPVRMQPGISGSAAYGLSRVELRRGWGATRIRITSGKGDGQAKRERENPCVTLWAVARRAPSA